jgi:hypothetical protein
VHATPYSYQRLDLCVDQLTSRTGQPRPRTVWDARCGFASREPGHTQGT